MGRAGVLAPSSPKPAPLPAAAHRRHCGSGVVPNASACAWLRPFRAGHSRVARDCGMGFGSLSPGQAAAAAGAVAADGPVISRVPSFSIRFAMPAPPTSEAGWPQYVRNSGRSKHGAGRRTTCAGEPAVQAQRSAAARRGGALKNHPPVHPVCKGVRGSDTRPAATCKRSASGLQTRRRLGAAVRSVAPSDRSSVSGSALGTTPPSRSSAGVSVWWLWSPPAAGSNAAAAAAAAHRL